MNKLVLLGAGAVVLLILSIGAWFLFSADATTPVEPKKINLIGVWESTDDPRAVIVYSIDGTVRELYDGEEKQKGTWIVVDKVSEGAIPSLGVLQTVINGENYVYTILEVTDSVLVVSYQQRGNVITYIRRNSLPQPSSAGGFSINKVGTAIKEGRGTGRVNPVALVLGDHKYATSPKVGYIYSCQTSFDEAEASEIGGWINEEAGTYDSTAKPSVGGSYEWSDAFMTMSTTSSARIISSNGVPTNHGTGDFPIDPSDEMYVYDQNLNTVSEQSVSLSLPLAPQIAENASCVPKGAIGVALNGVAIFSGFDAYARDAAAYEIHDSCDGHPDANGEYHYHSGSQCFEDTVDGQQHSALFGYALDGFGLYGKKSGGTYVNNKDLDACHGHVHEVAWDDEVEEMYHYHLTDEYPYTLGCFKGEVAGETLAPDDTEVTSLPDTTSPISEYGDVPPSGALAACDGKVDGNICSVIIPDGPREGTCRIPSDWDELTCVADQA